MPNGWASVRAAKMSYESFLRMVSSRRRMGITGELITSRYEAAEIRAFTAQHTLLGEHRRIAAQRTAENVRVEHRKTVVRLIGRTLSGWAPRWATSVSPSDCAPGCSFDLTGRIAGADFDPPGPRPAGGGSPR